ncbi:hypothetical protein [Mariniphaga sp.]|uniref:hypothetical protein n=1 Tax=Mariniphaga sp. TaxID=1954475 RepID=UPI003565A771
MLFSLELDERPPGARNEVRTSIRINYHATKSIFNQAECCSVWNWMNGHREPGMKSGLPSE